MEYVHVYWKIPNDQDHELANKVRAFTYASGRTCDPMPLALAEEWVKDMNLKYGVGTHWMMEVKRA